MDFQNSTRRSFVKKTTALAVGIPTVTLFSGLLFANPQSSSCATGGFMGYSKIDTGVGHLFPDGSIHWIHDCKATSGPGCCRSDTRSCGKFSKAGQLGTTENVNVTYDQYGNHQTVQCY